MEEAGWTWRHEGNCIYIFDKKEGGAEGGKEGGVEGGKEGGTERQVETSSETVQYVVLKYSERNSPFRLKC